MKLPTKGPDGKFIGEGQMITAWLPVMLSACWGGNALGEMLSVACRWCERRAGHEYAVAAEALKNDKWLEGAAAFAVSRTVEAQLWFARIEVLRDAKRKLEAIK